MSLILLPDHNDKVNISNETPAAVRVFKIAGQSGGPDSR